MTKKTNKESKKKKYSNLSNLPLKNVMLLLLHEKVRQSYILENLKKVGFETKMFLFLIY